MRVVRLAVVLWRVVAWSYRAWFSGGGAWWRGAVVRGSSANAKAKFTRKTALYGVVACRCVSVVVV